VTAAVHTIVDLDDPLVAIYRNMPDRTLRGESIFVAEGRILTQRLLASGFEVESVFVTPDYLDEVTALAEEGVPVYVAEEALMLKIVGFKFHRGMMAAGRRPEELALDKLLPRPEETRRLRLAVCPEITKPENMGLMFRAAAGLGADGLIFGERSCDPFSRRALRVSMGTVLSMPYRKATCLRDDLQAIRHTWRVELFAAVLDAEAEPLDKVVWPDRAAVLIGNEFDGLGREWVELCQRKVTIPMARATDSLNLGVAAGIFLYAMKRK
jgi:tRNA G18 (ribose-2'-O)-methylase SpoU